MRTVIALTLWNVAVAAISDTFAPTMRDCERHRILMEAAIAARMPAMNRADVEFIACAFLAACERSGEIGECLSRFLPEWSCTDGHRACLAIAHDAGLRYV